VSDMRSGDMVDERWESDSSAMPKFEFALIGKDES